MKNKSRINSGHTHSFSTGTFSSAIFDCFLSESCAKSSLVWVSGEGVQRVDSPDFHKMVTDSLSDKQNSD